MASRVKISLFVAAVFLALGVYLPFFPKWLELQGFSAANIALLITVPLIVRIFFTPIAMGWVMKFTQRRYAVTTYSAIAFVAFALLSTSSSFWSMAIVLAIYGAFWATLMPLGDSFALTEVRLNGANYGTIRLWGSVAFIVANLSAGFLLPLFGLDGIYWVITCFLGLGIVFAWFLPSYGLSPEERDLPKQSALASLLVHVSDRKFLIIACGAGLVQASHALLYGFGTIDWLARGYTTFEIGLFWAIGVVAEIILFTKASTLFKRVGPLILLMIGALSACLRWAFHGAVDGVSLILLWQVLHGLSFGATHLGMQAFIAETVDEAGTPAAQGANIFLGGVLMAVVTFASGFLFESFGNQAFWAMSLLSALSCLMIASFYWLSPKR